MNLLILPKIYIHCYIKFSHTKRYLSHNLITIPLKRNFRFNFHIIDFKCSIKSFYQVISFQGSTFIPVYCKSVCFRLMIIKIRRHQFIHHWGCNPRKDCGANQSANKYNCQWSYERVRIKGKRDQPADGSNGCEYHR